MIFSNTLIRCRSIIKTDISSSVIALVPGYLLPRSTGYTPIISHSTPSYHTRSSGGSKGGSGGSGPPLRFPGKSSCTWKNSLYLLKNSSKFVWLDLSPKDDQNRGEDTKISKIFLGENPPKTINGFHNLIKLKSMKWQKLIAIFSRAWSNS